MRVHYLDGLRGFGAVMVALDHIGLDFGITERIQKSHSPLYLFFNGTLALYIFFVVSGYALTLSVADQSAAFDLRRTVLARWLRLGVPALLSILLALGFMYAGLLPAGGGEPRVWSQEHHLFQPDLFRALYEGIVGTLIVGMARYNPVLWTLKWEFMCSLALYLAVWAWFRRAWLAAHLPGAPSADLVGRIGIGVAVAIGAFLSRSYLYLYACFLWGMALVIVDRSDRVRGVTSGARRVIGFLAATGLVVAIALNAWTNVPEWWGVALAAAAIHAGVEWCRPLTALFSSRPFRLLGRLSFPIYLVHFTVFGVSSVPVHRWVVAWGVPAPEWVTAAIVFAAVVVVAFAFAVVERSVRRVAAMVSGRVAPATA